MLLHTFWYNRLTPFDENIVEHLGLTDVQLSYVIIFDCQIACEYFQMK